MQNRRQENTQFHYNTYHRQSFWQVYILCGTPQTLVLQNLFCQKSMNLRNSLHIYIIYIFYWIRYETCAKCKMLAVQKFCDYSVTCKNYLKNQSAMKITNYIGQEMCARFYQPSACMHSEVYCVCVPCVTSSGTQPHKLLLTT